MYFLYFSPCRPPSWLWYVAIEAVLENPITIHFNYKLSTIHPWHWLLIASKYPLYIDMHNAWYKDMHMATFSATFVARLSRVHQVTWDTPCMCSCTMNQLTQRNSELHHRKVTIGAQDFTDFVSHISQGVSAVCIFINCVHWRVCTLAGHICTRDTPTCFHY